MVVYDYGQGTQIPKQKNFQEEEAKKSEKQKCTDAGGSWDEQTQTCIYPKATDNKNVTVEPSKTGFDMKTGKEVTQDKSNKLNLKNIPEGATVITDANGNERIQTKEERDRLENFGPGPSASEQVLINQQLAQQGAQLAGQVGDFNPLGVSPTGLDFGEAATAGIVGSIPRALSYAAIGAGAGALGTGPAAPIGAVVGAIGGFVAGLAGGMISNMKSQRSDTTTAQQRVLDEGKQTMKDWATMAETDPANKARYLAEYNKVAAQINQAYRQMKLDTSRDFAKFETALPNLAEFEAFYAAGGERDTLDIEMRNALMAQSQLDYKFTDLSNRYGGSK